MSFIREDGFENVIFIALAIMLHIYIYLNFVINVPADGLALQMS